MDVTYSEASPGAVSKHASPDLEKTAPSEKNADLESCLPELGKLSPGSDSEGNIDPDDLPLLNLSKSRKILILAFCCIANLVDAFSFNLLLPGIPSIEADLNMNVAEGSWILSAQTAAIASTCLLGGRAADVLGAKRVLLLGLALCTLASGIGGYSKWAALTLTCRGLQGLSVALQIPAAVKILTTIYPNPKEQASVLAIFTSCIPMGFVVGAPVGALLSAVSWRWGFYLIAIATGAGFFACLLVVPKLPENRGKRPNLDWVGLVLVTAGLLCLIFGIVTGASSQSWIQVSVLLPMLLSILVLVPGFIWWESRIPRFEDCLIPPEVWKLPNLALLALVNMTALPTMNTPFYANTVYWRDQFGWGYVSVAVHILPLGVAGLIVAIIAAVRPTLFNPRYLIPPGLLLGTLTSLLASFQDSTDKYWKYEFPSLLLTPVATTTIQVCCYVGIVQVCTKEMSGVASALYNCSLQVGSSIGLSLYSVIQATVASKRPAGSFDGIAWADRWNAFMTVALCILFLVFYRKPATL